MCVTSTLGSRIYTDDESQHVAVLHTEASRRLGHGPAAGSTPPAGRREGHAAITAIAAGEDGSDAPSLNVPLFNVQLDMKSRQQIAEPLITQIMVRHTLQCYAVINIPLDLNTQLSLAVHQSPSVARVAHCVGVTRLHSNPSHQGLDTLTPLGRGQAQLLTGSPGSLQHDAALDVILGQAGSDVRCVYAAVGKSVEETRRAVELLSQHGALAYTTVRPCWVDHMVMCDSSPLFGTIVISNVPMCHTHTHTRKSV